MTDTQLTIIIAAIVPTITALAGLVVGVINSIKANDTRSAVKANDVKTDTVIEKAVEIHTLTNGANSELRSALQNANTKIEGMQTMIASLVEAKGVADRLAEKPAASPTEASPSEVMVMNKLDAPVPMIATIPEVKPQTQ